MAIMLHSARRSCLVVMKPGLLLFQSPVCSANTWCTDLGNGAQSHPNSPKISSVQSCHHPLMMLSPANCGPSPASGRPLAEGGAESVGRYPSSFFREELSFHSSLEQWKLNMGPFPASPALVPASSLFSSYHHLGSPSSFSNILEDSVTLSSTGIN